MLASIRAALTRDSGVLLASMFLATVPMGYLQVVLPLYLNRAGLDPDTIGLLYTISGLVSAGLVAFSGLLADRFGRRRFILLGTALPALSYTVFGLTIQPGWLVVASVMGGVGFANGAAGAMTGASFDALLAEHTPPKRRTEVFTWAQGLWDLALGLGAMAAVLPDWLRMAMPALGDLGAYRPPFVLALLLALAATGVLLPLSDDAKAAAERAATGRGWLPRRSRSAILRYSLAIGLVGFGLGVVVQLMPLWFKLRFGVEEAALGPWYAAAQVLSLSALVVAPWLDRRLGGGRAVAAAQVTGGVVLALIALAETFEVAAVLFVARNVMMNISWPLQQAVLMSAVVPEERATAAGTGFAVWGFANALGPVLAGRLLQAETLLVPLLIGAAVYVLAGVMFAIGFSPASLKRLTEDASSA